LHGDSVCLAHVDAAQKRDLNACLHGDNLAHKDAPRERYFSLTAHPGGATLVPVPEHPDHQEES
jgi:hypothetical protein